MSRTSALSHQTVHSPRISVCIPAYNRPELLPELLESIFKQDFQDYEIVICEDASPARSRIAAVVASHAAARPGRIRYFENERNLGYDGNVRELFHRATGDYVFLLGNDDLMAPGALATVSSALERTPHIGVILRSYATFQGNAANIVETHRYFPERRVFPAGPETCALFYRRTVVVSGMTFNRERALAYDTSAFDGRLLYQVYLAANILLDMDGLFVPEALALYRLRGTPDFGNSEAEREHYTPGKQTVESSLAFVRGYLEIARHIEEARGAKVYSAILTDTANYSFPLLAIQEGQRNKAAFLRYAFQLGKLGLWRNPLFFAYTAGLTVLGSRVAVAVIRAVKRRVGHTPRFGAAAKEPPN